MIFVCLGTKRFPFNRLLEQIDLLVEHKEIQEKVYAQIGHSTYIPKNYKFSEFLSTYEYTDKVNEAKIIITHGGTGAIIKGLKAEKQVIGVPRREKFGEHSDDHQLQIVEFFTDNGYIRRVDEMEELSGALRNIIENPITKRFQGEGRITDIIDEFIN